VEFFADKNFHLHIGFLQKFQNFITNKKFLQTLKSFPFEFLNKEENVKGILRKRSNSDEIRIEKSNIQKVIKNLSFKLKV